MAEYKNKSTDTLMEVIASLSGKEDCYAFFEDVCTIKEMQDMAQRLETAILLKEGQSYQKISALVGASATTISRVNKCLNYGSGGYKLAIDYLNGKDDKK